MNIRIENKFNIVAKNSINTILHKIDCIKKFRVSTQKIIKKSEGSWHFPVQNILVPPTKFHGIHTFAGDILIHAELPASKHILDSPSELVYLQQKKNLPVQLIESINNFILVFFCLIHNL